MADPAGVPALSTQAPEFTPLPPADPRLDPPDGSIACVVCGKFCKKGVGITAHMRKHSKRRRPAASRKAKAEKEAKRPAETEFDTKLAIEHTPSEVAFVLREMARKAEARAEKLRELADELDREAEIGKAVGRG